MSSSLSLSTTCTGVIGAGNMGEALIAGLIKAGAKPSQICFSEKRSERAAEITAKYGAMAKSNQEIAQGCDAILLVTKPQDLESVLSEIAASLKPRALLISFAAGKTTDFIERIVGKEKSVIRVMPNTPALIGKGAAAISEGSAVLETEMDFVRSVMSAMGEVITVKEEFQDAVTALSGSGPAYFFAFVESMIAAGVELGLTEADATTLTIQTIYGAAGMLKESGKSATELRQNVTSPNGTTAAALKAFEGGDLQGLVLKAMVAARNRSQELA